MNSSAFSPDYFKLYNAVFDVLVAIFIFSYSIAQRKSFD